jgi:PAS domain S-box-containing protein
LVLHTHMHEPQSGLPGQGSGRPSGASRSFACVGTALAALVSLVTLVCWLAGLPLETNWGPDLTMKPVTALAIALIASATLREFWVASPWRIAIGVLAALLGVSSLMQEFSGLDFRLESWLAPADATPGTILVESRMSPATALAVLLGGTAAALLPFPRLTDATRFLAMGVGVIGATGLLSYLLGIDILRSFSPFGSVALPTAVASIAICASVLMHGQLLSPARTVDFRLLLSQFFVPLLIFALFAWWSWRSVEADARATAERTAISFSEYAQRVFEIQETALEAVLRFVNGRSAADIASDPSTHEFLSQIQKHTPTSDAMILARSDTGRVIASSRGFSAPEVSVSQRDLFKAHRSGYQGTYIGEVIDAKPFGGIAFTISRRDPAAGIIAVADMLIDSFFQASGTQASPRDVIGLVRADGIVASLHPRLVDPVGFRLPQDAMAFRIMRGESKPGTIAPGVDGIERLWQLHTVGGYPVYVIYGLDVVLIRTAWLRHIVPFGLVTLSASVLTYGLSRRWRRAQDEAAAARARAERAEALARVEQARDDLVQLTERSDDLVAMADLDERFTYMNSAGKRMIGLDLEGDPHDLHFSDCIAPESLSNFKDTFIPTVREHDHASVEMKLRNVTTGEPIDVICSTFLLLDRKGTPNQLATVTRDITGRKRHEEHLNLLMHEVNHRAKNILSVVQAISHQTAAKNPKDFLARFTERLQALSANQDLLVRSEWGGVDIGELVRAQLATFKDLIGSRILVDGAKLRFNSAAAQAVGLALHELATNASKYGALSTKRGSVTVHWWLDGSIFVMNWTERGGPPVCAPTQRGFGSTVLSLMVKRTLGGEVQLDYAPSGVIWTLACPSANTLEARQREQVSAEG